MKKNKEVRNASWIIIGKVFQLGLSFVVSMFTARYLGPSDYGLINYASSFMIFFTAFCTLGLNSVIVKNFVDYPEEQGKAIGSSIILRLVSSLISVLLIFVIICFVDYGEWKTISVVTICSVSLIFQPFDIFYYWFQNRYQSKVTALASLLAYIVTSLYKIFLLITNKSIQWFAFATSIDYILLSFFLLIAYQKYDGPKLQFNYLKCKQLLGKSKHYILSGMMIAIYGQIDKFMIKHMLDEVAVGYYSLATTINNMWVFVLAAIIDSMYPTILQIYVMRDKQKFNKKNRQLYAIVIYVSFVIAICFMIFGKTIIKIAYGEAYLPAYEPLKYIVWYTIFSYLGVARNAWIVCENKQIYLKYLYISAAVINIILNFIFIPISGIVGAAVASLITQIMTGIIIPAFIKPLKGNVKLIIDAFLLRDLM